MVYTLPFSNGHTLHLQTLSYISSEWFIWSPFQPSNFCKSDFALSFRESLISSSQRLILGALWLEHGQGRSPVRDQGMQEDVCLCFYRDDFPLFHWSYEASPLVFLMWCGRGRSGTLATVLYSQRESQELWGLWGTVETEAGLLGVRTDRWRPPGSSVRSSALLAPPLPLAIMTLDLIT